MEIGAIWMGVANTVYQVVIGNNDDRHLQQGLASSMAPVSVILCNKYIRPNRPYSKLQLNCQNT